ncbi:MAG: hypothetical protein COS34_01930 [Lysobacterales bacterium CG02_land_8_20_14_3_00_62_12]|nr:MAG: hypothetical protein COS34_01930 [Xanthomonadales bacterium CG02_land_8_20_14_3_00_62_12]
MIRKSRIAYALAGLALFAGMQAEACTTSQWGVGLTGGAGGAQAAIGGVVAGQPNGLGGGTATRYSGLCGLRASGLGQYVQDGTPTAEGTYIARFYVYTGVTSGTPVVFSSMEGAPAPDPNQRVYSVQYNRANQQFEAVNQAGTVTAIGAASSALANKWFHVHLTWDRTAGSLDVSVQGAGSSTPNATASLSGFTSSGGAAGPDFAQLGWISGAAAGRIDVDAFESRRSTAIPPLCRGNANASDETRNILDAIAVFNEINAVSLATGQPDTNEDGAVNILDAIALFTIINSASPGC